MASKEEKRLENLFRTGQYGKSTIIQLLLRLPGNEDKSYADIAEQVDQWETGVRDFAGDVLSREDQVEQDRVSREIERQGGYAYSTTPPPPIREGVEGADFTEMVSGMVDPSQQTYQFKDKYSGSGFPEYEAGQVDTGSRAFLEFEKKRKQREADLRVGKEVQTDFDAYSQREEGLVSSSEAERQALLEGQARQEEIARTTSAFDTDMLLTGPDSDPVGGVDAIPDVASADTNVAKAEAKVATAKTPQGKIEAKADLAKAKSIQKQSNTVASGRAKQATATGIRDENDLKSKIANDPNFSSQDAETWLMNNRGFSSTKASQWVYDRRLENAGRAPRSQDGAQGAAQKNTPQFG